MRIFLLSLAALVAAPAAAAQAPVRPAGPDYSADRNWLCLPGRADVCSTPLATTALGPGGYGATDRSRVAKNPPVDCFFVYPTVSNDQGLNSDLNPGREEKLTAESQFARFAAVCRPFAPVYRQMTLASIAAYAAGADVSQAAAMAYGDVAAAFRSFIARRSAGRPFVLIGHSQGSLMLQMLITREIETSPGLMRRMKLAIIPGYDVLVPQGKLVGGTFKRTPLCSRPGETACVMSWVSYREKNAPPSGAVFGFARQAGMTVGCVNPARFGARDWVALDSYWFARSTLPVAGGPIRWSSEGAPPGPYVRTAGLASAQCVNDGPRGYLSIRTNADPKDKRTDRIGGEVGLFGMFVPGWGMHLADIALAQGDLVGAVEDAGRR